MKLRIACWMAIIAFAFSCKDTVITRTVEEQLEYDISLIDEYLVENNIQAQTHFSGLKYVIHTLGTGPLPTKDNCLTVNYSGRLLGESDENPFDSDTGYTAWIKNHIPGWQIGFKLIPVGSSATFYIPSQLGYGSTPRTGMPANSVLVFTVDLVAISKYHATGGYCYQ